MKGMLWRAGLMMMKLMTTVAVCKFWNLNHSEHKFRTQFFHYQPFKMEDIENEILSEMMIENLNVPN